MADDATKEAKANLKAEKARIKAMRPWYRKKRFVLPLAVLVIAVIAVAASGGSDDADDVAGSGASSDTADDASSDSGPRSLSGNDENPPANDVELTACRTDDLNHLEAVIEVTNKSSKASNYSVTVAFESPDGSQQYDTGAAFINGLEPGQSKTEDVATFKEPSGEYTCRITEVDRFAA